MMPVERVQRRLAAIVSADVVGYSRLMGEDETGTLGALKELRTKVIDPIIAEYRGRIVKLMGDGALFEFGSAVDAVECAVRVQRRVAEWNLEIPDSKSITFRVGVNVGDVIIDGDDIYGDGVNVAARLEKLADPGGICISGMVFDQVKGKVDAGFEDFGIHQVKNIADPVRTYRVTSVSVSISPSGHIAAPAKPSIAVLPFDNMSDDHAQEYFADGISEDLTTALSRFEWLFVIARNSAFTYKGKAVDEKRVGRELGVRYILEGSVRRAGDRVRINAQLIEAETDRQVWAQRYDRKMDDLFELQDDIVANIAATVGPEITFAEIERARVKRPDDLDAWEHYLRALAAYHRMTKGDMDAAIIDLERAIKLEPEFADAHALLGKCHLNIGMRGWIRPARPAFEEARRCTERAVRLAPTRPEANQSLALVLAFTGEAEQAIRVARYAIDLNPNLAEAYTTLGFALIFCGDLEAGLAACQKAERGSPRNSRGTYLYDAMGHGYFFLGDYEKAIEVAKKGLRQDPSPYGLLVTLACAYAALGRGKEARHYIDELLHYIPRFSLRALQKNPMFVDPKLIDRLIECMRLAGLPE
jgi:TolB-like protein/class 3 adenylate cyclase/Tfp pilus assembly protein PilF